MKFYIKQKVFSLKDKFTIMDEAQNVIYEVKGKFMSIKNKLELADKDGVTLLRSEEKYSVLCLHIISMIQEIKN